jgi:integrase/recombinase XerD
MENLINKFLKYVEAREKYSNNTLVNYRIVYKQFMEFWEKDITKVSLIDIEDFIIYLKNKNPNIKKATINLKISALYSLFEYLRTREYINKNPTDGIERITPPQKEKVTLTRIEINRMIHYAHCKRDKAIIALFFAGGFRISELRNLNISDICELPQGINEEGKMIHIREAKNYKERFVFISQKYFKYVEEYLKERNDDISTLFISNRKKRIHVDTVRKMIEKLSKELNIDKKITPHVLRKSFATYLNDKGILLPLISENLGHSSTSTSQRFYVEDNKTQRGELTLKAFK